jgi:hypothetical protein
MEYHLNLEKISSISDTPEFIKGLIKLIKSNGHITVGSWLKTVATLDLMAASFAAVSMRTNLPPAPGSLSSAKDDEVMRKTDRIGDLPFSVPSSFIILTDLLATGEGIDLSFQEVPGGPGSGGTLDRIKILEMYISLEMLKRKGFDIIIHYDRMSLGSDEESSDAIIVDYGSKFNDQISNERNALSSNLTTLSRKISSPLKSRNSGSTSDPSKNGGETDGIPVSRLNRIDIKDVPPEIVEQIVAEAFEQSLGTIQGKIDAYRLKDGEKGSGSMQENNSNNSNNEAIDEFVNGININILKSKTFKGRMRDRYNTMISWIKSFRKANIKGKAQE